MNFRPRRKGSMEDSVIDCIVLARQRGCTTRKLGWMLILSGKRHYILNNTQVTIICICHIPYVNLINYPVCVNRHRR